MCLLTSPIQGEVLVIIVCVCVCVSVCLCVCYRSSERYECFKSQSKVPTESARRREQINVGIELKILGSKVMTVISLP